MKKLTVFGFYGSSNTGKTTLILEIIKYFTKQGLNVATVKITDKNIDIDSKGKDTWRFSKAGSKLVVLSSPTETDFLLKSKMNIEKTIQYIQNLLDCDIILIEGAKDPSIQKIRLGKNIKERENTIISYTNNLDEVIEKIKSEIIQKKQKERSIKKSHRHLIII